MSGVVGESGKMFRVPSVQTKEETSGKSSKRSSMLPLKDKKKSFMFLCLKSGIPTEDVSWTTKADFQSAGESLTPSIGESPNVVVESTLSQILMDAEPKYSLSARACRGILNRAERRGKELPAMLKEALLEAIKLEEEKDEG